MPNNMGSVASGKLITCSLSHIHIEVDEWSTTQQENLLPNGKKKSSSEKFHKNFT